MPKPTKGESRDDFIERFMSDPAMKAMYPNRQQRLAIANQYWLKKSNQ